MFVPGDKIMGPDEITILRVLSEPKNASMGTVYLVEFASFTGQCAAKTFRDEVDAFDHRAARILFLNEVSTWCRMDSHPNILAAKTVDVYAERPMVFTDYCAHGDLSIDIQQKRYRHCLKPFLQFAMQICDGMSHARSKGIVAHRDIKPTDLFLVDRMVKIGDFGISQSASRRLPSDCQSLFRDTVIGVGTLAYLAPELWEAPGLYSEQSDIYATGLVLAELYGGHLPFSACSGEMLREWHLNTQPTLDDLPSSAFRAVVMKCLHKSPSGRYSCFAELREDLASVYSGHFRGKPPRPAQRGPRYAVEWDFNRGIFYFKLGRAREAVECFDNVLQVAQIPHFVLARAGAHEKAGNIEEALKDSKEAARLDRLRPLHRQGAGLLAQCISVDLLLRLHRDNEAQAIALEMSEYYGETKYGLVAKAMVDIAHCRYASAIECCDRALARFYQTALDPSLLLFKLVAILALEKEDAVEEWKKIVVWNKWLSRKRSVDTISIASFRCLIDHGHLKYARVALEETEAVFCGNKDLLGLLEKTSRITNRHFEADEFEAQSRAGVYC